MRVTAAVAVLWLSLPAWSQESPVFPDDFCGSLPAVDAEARSWLDANAPDFEGAAGRALTPERALELLGKAVQGGWSSLQLFTQDAVRGDCAVYLGPATVDAIRGAYELFLISPLEGADTKGQPFKATAIVFGRGLVRIFYDRPSFRHEHVHFNEKFGYTSPVRMKTPELGLMKVDGITGPMGLAISQLKIEGEKVAVQAGPFSVKRALRRIKPKAEPAPAPAEPPASAPEAALRWLAPGRLQSHLERP